MKLVKYILLFASSLSLVGCFEKGSLNRWIDNPTANEIKLKIDNTELTIPARSGVDYEFDFGKHTLTYNNETLTFVVKPAKLGTTSFINPTQSNYFVRSIILAAPNTNNEEYEKVARKELRNIPVIIDGDRREFTLPAKLINDVIIDRYDNNWDYSFDEELPKEEADLSKNTTNFEIKRKLYRQNDYLKYLLGDEVRDRDEFIFPYEPQKFEKIKKYSFAKINLNEITCEPGREYMKNLLDNWENLFKLKGGDFASSYNKLVSDDENHKNNESEKLCTQENDPNKTYHKNLTKFLKSINDVRDVHLYVIN